MPGTRRCCFSDEQGYRVIAHDRRGHGRSGQPWHGNNMDQYADDVAELMEHLDVTDAIMVGHSTGGGEVVRYIARHGQKRVAKAVLIAAVPPLMLKTENNPGGLPMSAFDEIRAGVANDRSQFFKDLSLPFYGYNKPGRKSPQGVRNRSGCRACKSAVVGAYDCIKAFSETDQTEDLKEDHCPDARDSGRCRSDRADRRFRKAKLKTRQKRDAPRDSWCTARTVHDTCGRYQSGASRISQAIADCGIAMPIRVELSATVCAMAILSRSSRAMPPQIFNWALHRLMNRCSR